LRCRGAAAAGYNRGMSPVQTNGWIPPPLRKLGGRMLADALNRVVKLDPDTQTALAQLETRRIGVHLRGPDIAFDVAVHDGALSIEPPQQGAASARGDAGTGDEVNPKPDLRVSASPFSLFAMALPRDGDTLPPGKVEIAGDAELARRLEKLAREFTPDMEAAFARVFGEVIGVAIAHGLRDATRWLHIGAQHAVADSVDWLRDEARLAVPRGELDDFLDEVDGLRERAERLQARVRRLEPPRSVVKKF